MSLHEPRLLNSFDAAHATKVKAFFLPNGPHHTTSRSDLPPLVVVEGFAIQTLDIPTVVSPLGEFNPLVELVFRTEDMAPFVKTFITDVSTSARHFAVYSSLPGSQSSSPSAAEMNPWNAHLLVFAVDSDARFVGLSELDLPNVLSSLLARYPLSALHARTLPVRPINWLNMPLCDLYVRARNIIVDIMRTPPSLLDILTLLFGAFLLIAFA
ncbi:hypothetical protein NLJ89_g8761 [Agrocybe chaxingu]|uniref:Uncharacterized protein n=1 Tax=Agrocybe chaxingu TaxID=84603 RepID=A0A9W8JWZ4_9AGAR|nr:hypothetical protein NLJ89_g8761 [Agrocybe chaxingu]